MEKFGFNKLDAKKIVKEMDEFANCGCFITISLIFFLEMRAGSMLVETRSFDRSIYSKREVFLDSAFAQSRLRRQTIPLNKSTEITFPTKTINVSGRCGSLPK